MPLFLPLKWSIASPLWKTFFQLYKKKFKLNFDLCQRAKIVQVGLNMNLYDDIGDTSSSLQGLTSSFMKETALAWNFTSNNAIFPAIGAMFDCNENIANINNSTFYVQLANAIFRPITEHFLEQWNPVSSNNICFTIVSFFKL